MNDTKEPKPIFSEHITEKFERIARNVRADTDFLINLVAVGLTIATILLVFWWWMLGSVAVNVYAMWWATTYPTTPLDVSTAWNFLKIMDVVTLLFLVSAWTILISYLIFTTFNKLKRDPREKLLVPIYNSTKDEPKYITIEQAREIVKNQLEPKYLTVEQAMKIVKNQLEPKQSPKHTTKPAKKLKRDVCPYCASTKVREAGKSGDHAGQIYCKSCKEFYR